MWGTCLGLRALGRMSHTRSACVRAYVHVYESVCIGVCVHGECEVVCLSVQVCMCVVCVHVWYIHVDVAVPDRN